ncbi:hypothetical protein B0T24DRAFT_718644 [Lasiosphaeria ovina]|uniref:Uncharacterized protein n=1 Tax=Lasiosphaeria ovina TaxID=92902 RepID=A0AAE0KHH7_9PEZI|nr:hypothetical protein B0T24DRAFT_718644 [Lasiosphaeria ovina]
MNFYSQRQIKELAQQLQEFVSSGRDEAITSTEGKLGTRILSETVNRIQSWLESEASEFLWVEGYIFPCDLTPTALRITACMFEAGIPCVYFFDQDTYPSILSPKSGRAQPREETALVCLLYTLIDQLVTLLPTTFTSDTDLGLGEQAFQELNGTMESADLALQVIQALIAHAPNHLVVVIDGVLDLESESATTWPYFEELVDILRRESRREKLFKVLVTTNGMSPFLCEALEEDEREVASNMAVQFRHGRRLQGTNSVDDVSFEV